MKLLDFIKIPKGESMIQDMMSTLERHINYRERRAYSTPFGNVLTSKFLFHIC